jgi:hypothetical protein
MINVNPNQSSSNLYLEIFERTFLIQDIIPARME